MENACTPILLMVSGGSDSTALLELAAAGELVGVSADALFKVLHVNHMLRGADADADEAFVLSRCDSLGIPCIAEHVDIAALAARSSEGMEAVAREQRYLAADRALDAWCVELGTSPGRGLICTAHTLDDRVETFLLRALVGTGPGGLGSIPRERGRIRRPLLGTLREELRVWLRKQHPGQPDAVLWREDPTNTDGSNFRSQVREELLPAMRRLRPGFERSLERTMDLIAEEDAMLASGAASVALRNLETSDESVRLPLSALENIGRPQARRVLRQCLLAANPQARLEAAQIERVLNNLHEGYATELAGGLRVRVTGGGVEMARPRRASR